MHHDEWIMGDSDQGQIWERNEEKSETEQREENDRKREKKDKRG